ncbi:MAG TPA: glutathione S-transferase family protein [Polyangiaceae bacterium]
MDALQIVGRSSSHFTRVVRMFAEEVAVPYAFQVLPNILSDDANAYGGNPGLRLPNLITSDGPVFGSLNGCRALATLAAAPFRMVWPEATSARVAANALELTLQSMSTEVTLIMLGATNSASSVYADKLRSALRGMLTWLDANLAEAIAALPERQLSYLELSLFCLIDHLEFRKVMTLDAYANLRRFRDHFANRRSAEATLYRFDA